MAAQPLRPMRAALLRQGLKNICQVVRVISGSSNYLCTESVGLRLILAAIFGRPRLSAHTAEFGAGLSKDGRSAEDHPKLCRLVPDAVLFCLLSCSVPECNVRYLVCHYAGKLTFVLRTL